MTPRKSVPPPSGCICGDPACAVQFGYCHCRCGGKTKISPRDDKRTNEIKGMPRRFIHGHHRTQQRQDLSSVWHFKIDGVYCRLIPLTQGQYTIVWESDYKWLMRWRWFAIWSDESRCYYAARAVKRGKGKFSTLSMHRQILGLANSDPREGDHKNPWNTLDNRRDNLRLAGRSGQMQNRRINKRNTSGYKGVNLCPNGKSYRARIMINGKRVHLGVRRTAKAAHDELFVPAALKHYGEFARFK